MPHDLNPGRNLTLTSCIEEKSERRPLHCQGREGESDAPLCDVATLIHPFYPYFKLYLTLWS